jgi:osmotically-inducible protein OsmY
MRIPTTLKVVVALLLVVAFAGCQSMTGRSAGRVVDDKAISAKVKTKLTAEKVSNLTRVGVTTVNGVVHLDGVVDRVQDKQRAEEIARGVDGVTRVVDNIQVSTTPSASPTTSTPSSTK